jgi:hypothetical protein
MFATESDDASDDQALLDLLNLPPGVFPWDDESPKRQAAAAPASVCPAKLPAEAFASADPSATTFPVESVELPTDRWPTVAPSQLLAEYGAILSTSVDRSLVDFGAHPVLQGYLKAFREHRPITISPDIIWLLIVQGLTHHIAANSEDLRSMFVQFDGKKQLTMRRRDLKPDTATRDDWASMFRDFVGQISEYTGRDLVDTLTPNFTTTTPVSLAVAQVSVMAAMQHYFTYEVEMEGCGFPWITIEGTMSDWQAIRDKLQQIRKYKLKWWLSVLQPIILEIMNAKAGRINREFWLNMIRYRQGTGFYDPSYINGWICKLFPYDIHGGRMRLERIYKEAEMPSEMLTVPFNLVLVMAGQDPDTVKPIPCEFLAGFVGMTQNASSPSVKPEIGWLVREQTKQPSTPARHQRRRS